MRIKSLLVAVALSSLVAGCAVEPPYMAPPSALVAPAAIEGNSGAFMSPYTTDGVLAEWVDKSVNAKTGAAIGGAVGALAAQKLMENIPFAGLFAQQAGEALGRQAAIEMAGGEEFIKESSDLSFNNASDMAVWMYVNYSSHAHYKDALDATYAIYPELKNTYYQSLVNASAAVKPTNR